MQCPWPDSARRRRVVLESRHGLGPFARKRAVPHRRRLVSHLTGDVLPRPQRQRTPVHEVRCDELIHSPLSCRSAIHRRQSSPLECSRHSRALSLRAPARTLKGQINDDY